MTSLNNERKSIKLVLMGNQLIIQPVTVSFLSNLMCWKVFVIDKKSAIKQVYKILRHKSYRNS